MFEYFESLDEQLGKRYRTLENNLRSASNSFYDSYREVVQELVRVIFRREGLSLVRSDGTELEYSDRIELNRLLTSTSLVEHLKRLGVEDSVQSKLRDYISKVNRHVHTKEKEISFEGVVDYLTALYNFSAPYAVAKGCRCVPPSLNEINALYAEYEKSIASAELYEASFVTRVQGIIDESRLEPESRRPKFEELQPVSIVLDEQTRNAAFASGANRGLAFLGGERRLFIRKTIFLSLIGAMMLFAILYIAISMQYSALFIGSLFSVILYIIAFFKTVRLDIEFIPNVNGDLVMLDCMYQNSRLEGAGQFKTSYLWGFILTIIGLGVELIVSYLSSGGVRLLGFSWLHIIYALLELCALIFGYFFLFRWYKVIKLSGIDRLTGEKKILYSYSGKYYDNLADVGIDNNGKV